MGMHIKLTIYKIGVFINKIKNLICKSNIWNTPLYIPTEIIYSNTKIMYLNIDRIYDFTFSLNNEFNLNKNSRYKKNYIINSIVVYTLKNVYDTGYYSINISKNGDVLDQFINVAKNTRRSLLESSGIRFKL